MIHEYFIENPSGYNNRRKLNILQAIRFLLDGYTLTIIK